MAETLMQLNSLAERIRLNLTRELTRNVSLIDFANRYGIGHYIVNGGKTTRTGFSLSIFDIALYLASKKVSFSEDNTYLRGPRSVGVSRSTKERLVPPNPLFGKFPSALEVNAAAPDVWLTHPQAAEFLETGRNILAKLISEYTNPFLRLFPSQEISRRCTIFHGAMPQKNIIVYNPQLIGLIAWYRNLLKVPIEPGSKTVYSLSRELGVDFYTVDRLAKNLAATGPSFGYYAKPPRRRVAFWCTPRLIELIKYALRPDLPPTFIYGQYKWSTFEEVGNLRGDSSGQCSRIIASKYTKEHPEWLLPFRFYGHRLIEYCHPYLVKKIVEQHPRRR